MPSGLTRIGAAAIGGLLLAPAVRTLQEHPPTPHRHADGEALVNPVAKTPASAKAGSVVYAKACANCHGPYGLGNGRLAPAMAAYGGRPSNLTDSEWQHGSSDGEIFIVIRDGVGPDFHMPLFKGKLTDEEMWHVVNYIRTLGI
jgi:mono/diheme cytochrome c family protein